MSLSPLLHAAPIIIIHSFAAIGALILGATQFILPKASPRHKSIGYIWIILMVTAALSSFAITEVRVMGPFSPIHILSIVTLLTLVAALHAARQKNIHRHRRLMRILYISGPVVAGLFTLLPGRLMHIVVFGS